MGRKPRVLFHWPCMGPYHFARMDALVHHGDVDLHVVETTSLDDHHWKRAPVPSSYTLTTLSADMLSHRTIAATTERLEAEVARLEPDIVVACGYAGLTPWRALRRFRAAGGTILFWSESTHADHRRRWWRELAKSWLARRYAGAIVAGQPHRRYLEQLGLDAQRICVVGGVVDNEFFREAASRHRAEAASLRGRLGLPQHYFLFVGRLIPEKNLDRLLEAYQRYRQRIQGRTPWDLVLVGGGPEQSKLRTLCDRERVPGVHFAGLRQIEELTAYYALAGCFVLPSRSEPWGLVVNEAMACSLPVLVSKHCGCAEDLVAEGSNGFTFAPDNPAELTERLLDVAEGRCNMEELGRESCARIAAFSLQEYGRRLGRFLAGFCRSPQSFTYRARARET